MSSSLTQSIVDIKYANQVGLYLDRWKIKSQEPFVSTFRCPICGDSQKNKSKTRGYLYMDRRDNRVKFKCHNGCPSRWLPTFLKEVQPNLYKEYILESFGSSREAKGNILRKYSDSFRSGEKFSNGVRDREDRREIVQQKTEWSLDSTARRIDHLREDHPARTYCSKRGIPDHQLAVLLYVPKFTKFVNSIIPGKLKVFEHDEPRLIIPFINREGKCVGFQGRSFDPNANMRYISIMIDEDETKFFGLDRVNLNNLIYVVEGAIDALFLDNAVAAIQGDLAVAEKVLEGKRLCYIPDKDIRNPQIVRLIQKLIRNGSTVCLLPKEYDGKDINEMVLKNAELQDSTKLQKVVMDNTFSGARLKLEFDRWKRT